MKMLPREDIENPVSFEKAKKEIARILGLSNTTDDIDTSDLGLEYVLANGKIVQTIGELS